MSVISRRNIIPFALAGLATLLSPVEAQYYGYRRRNTGWRSIYLVAIIVPIVFIALIALFWVCIFRAIFRRRRERRNGALPTTTNNTSTLPSAYGQTYGNNNDNSYAYGQNGAGTGYNNTTSYQPPSSPYPVANNGGEAQGYYNSGSGGAPQYPQQAYGGNQQGYAPPSGPPPKR